MKLIRGCNLPLGCGVPYNIANSPIAWLNAQYYNCSNFVAIMYTSLSRVTHCQRLFLPPRSLGGAHWPGIDLFHEMAVASHIVRIEYNWINYFSQWWMLLPEWSIQRCVRVTSHRSCVSSRTNWLQISRPSVQVPAWDSSSLSCWWTKLFVWRILYVCIVVHESIKNELLNTLNCRFQFQINQTRNHMVSIQRKSCICTNDFKIY